MAVTLHKQANCGFVMLNNPPVNAINQKMREDLIDAVTWAENEGLERVILSGMGRSFAAGADTKEFDQLAISPHLPDVVKPVSYTHLTLPTKA